MVSGPRGRQPATMCNSTNCHLNLICQNVAASVSTRQTPRPIYFFPANKVIPKLKGETNSHVSHPESRQLTRLPLRAAKGEGGAAHTSRSRCHLKQSTHSAEGSLTFGRACVRVRLSASPRWRMTLRMTDCACLCLDLTHTHTHTHTHRHTRT